MQKIRKKILTDAAQRPVAVQIDYEDWLKIERTLGASTEEPRVTDLSRYHGIVSLTEEPLAYQTRVRNEWS
ncbi:MAG: hypothetical protein LAO07_13350 [Acidobacteriia bacterium]|nr:hypothetical protein [Terriglobia bacterium]